MKVEDFYTEPEEAVRILKERRRDKELVKKVTDFLGEIPEPMLSGEINAALFRNIFTPDYELDIFLEKTKKINARPILFEYTEDKFVAINEDKYSLGKMSFYLNTDSKGHVNTRSFKVIDFDTSEGKLIPDINTLWGESLVSFHHRLLKSFYPDNMKDIFDISLWFHKNGPYAKEYYKKMFALFICNGILFDNFRDHGEESIFLNEIAIPALEYLHDKFGEKPLICKMQEISDENNPKWWGYPRERLDEIINLSKTPSIYPQSFT
ncbi:MAG: hypothetical protein WC631_00640 [Candidatus Paceibacterota bacterium]|jgi:hypothetical protein